MNQKGQAHCGPAARIKQVLCTEYDAGVGIGWHRDKPHFDEVFGLSLGSACKFHFRRKSGGKWERFTLDVEPRSLYVMTGTPGMSGSTAFPRWKSRATPSPSARWRVDGAAH